MRRTTCSSRSTGRPVAATHDREKVRTWARDDRLFDPLREHERYTKLMA